MDFKLLAIFALFNLVAVASAVDQIENLVEDLKTSRLEAESNLGQDELDSINKVRSGIESHQDVLEALNEPIHEEFGDLTKSISELVESKGSICKSDGLVSDEGMALFGKEFDLYVLKPCEVIDRAYKSSLDEFQQLVQGSPDLVEKVEGTSAQEYEGLLNASVCRKIVNEKDIVRKMSFGQVVCIHILDAGYGR